MQAQFRVLFDNNSELLDINVVDNRPIVKMMIDGKTMSMEFDSGVSVSVCSKNWFLRLVSSHYFPIRCI